MNNKENALKKNALASALALTLANLLSGTVRVVESFSSNHNLGLLG